MKLLNKLLAPLDLALVRSSRMIENEEASRTIASLSELVGRLEDEKLQLGDKLLAVSRENEQPRCDGPFRLEIEDLRDQLAREKVVSHRLRCRITYYKNKSRKVVVA